CEVSHTLFLARRKELSPYKIPVRQLQILRVIQALGSKATLSEVAKEPKRGLHVISRHTIKMEKDGLIKRTHETPKSNLLRLELTEKGLEMVKLARKSKAIDTILSFLKKEEREEMEFILGQILVKAKKYDSKYY
ncbi:MAG: MarR family winged helix-turn-helix transcriptional regulator, partial [Dehalococcoidales bacterium]